MPKAGVNTVKPLLHVLNIIESKVKEATDGVANEILGENVFNIDVIHGRNQINALPAFAQAQVNMRTLS